MPWAATQWHTSSHCRPGDRCAVPRRRCRPSRRAHRRDRSCFPVTKSSLPNSVRCVTTAPFSSWALTGGTKRTLARPAAAVRRPIRRTTDMACLLVEFHIGIATVRQSDLTAPNSGSSEVILNEGPTTVKRSSAFPWSRTRYAPAVLLVLRPSTTRVDRPTTRRSRGMCPQTAVRTAATAVTNAAEALRPRRSDPGAGLGITVAPCRVSLANIDGSAFAVPPGSRDIESDLVATSHGGTPHRLLWTEVPSNNEDNSGPPCPLSPGVRRCRIGRGWAALM